MLFGGNDAPSPTQPKDEEAAKESPAAPSEDGEPKEAVRRCSVPEGFVVVFVEQAWRVYAPESPETHRVTILWGRDADGAYGAYLVGEPGMVDLVEYKLIDPIAGIYVPGRGHRKGPHTGDAEQLESCMVHLAHESPYEAVRVK
jgi:hypothetical protein